MKIIFDARVLQRQTHGIARYCRQLLDRLLTHDRGNEYRVIVRFPWVKDGFSPRIPVSWLETPVPPYTLREQWAIPRLLRNEPFDLFYSPTYALPRSLAAKGILTLHDLIHLVFPADYGWKYRLYYRGLVKPAADRCRRIFTVSRSSQEDIIRYFHCPADKIVLTPNGLDPSWFSRNPDPDLSGRYGLEAGFILFVGNPRPHKNFPRVLAAFEQLVQEGNFKGRLVAVGIPATGSPPAGNPRVIRIPYCSDAELAALYSGARLLAAPSLYEGFGLPVLEAMACGCPVLIGNRASLPEIAGPAGWAVDPYRTEDIREGMARILNDIPLREHLREQGRIQARRFSWEETAQTVRRVFRELAGGGE
ncbi:MAG: glycosyltransferase family 4 protein [Deltaproteobacteria bacterium]|nr:glycosyltransferase family 4 protein [Deltaproteobacteria bacterium]